LLLKHGQSPSLAQLKTIPSSSRQGVLFRQQVRGAGVDGDSVDIVVIDLILGLGNGVVVCDFVDVAAADGTLSLFVCATAPPTTAKMTNNDTRMPLTTRT